MAWRRHRRLARILVGCQHVCMLLFGFGIHTNALLHFFKCNILATTVTLYNLHVLIHTADLMLNRLPQPFIFLHGSCRMRYLLPAILILLLIAYLAAKAQAQAQAEG